LGVTLLQRIALSAIISALVDLSRNFSTEQEIFLHTPGISGMQPMLEQNANMLRAQRAEGVAQTNASNCKANCIRNDLLRSRASFLGTIAMSSEKHPTCFPTAFQALAL
jgi:hypothetical protein